MPVAGPLEAAVLDLALNARRGAFHFQVECTFSTDWTVIFGHSGAGKSTLLRLVAGLDEMEAGHVRLDGRSLTDSANSLWVRPGHRHTAMVAQQPALFPHLSVAANVAYGLSPVNRSSHATRVREMLELVDATDLLLRRVQHLSGGEAQRVALARALAPQPRLLLLDEPFSAMDGAASDSLLSRLRLWAYQNRVQTVLATHDATDALATAAEVALLHEGRLVAQGPAAVVLANERQRLLERLG